MLFGRKKITRSLVVVVSIIFIFSISSDAKSSNVKAPVIHPKENSNVDLKRFEAKTDTGEDCEYCYDNIYKGIEIIYGRTDIAGSRCYYCIRQSGNHSTKVYARREVKKCSNGCTYEILEYLPALYECESLE